MNLRNCLIYIALALLGTSCKTNNNIITGDIVFRGATTSKLSSAINEVTQTQAKNNYTHMGICEVVNKTTYVYHADYNKGVVKELLNEFIKLDNKEYYNVDLYRIKSLKKDDINKAIKQAKTWVGNPYNTTYILEDEGFYCSEYVYEVFKTDSIFGLEPMTFKDPKTNKFHNGWIEHYKALGIPIPEGKLGCNPNKMASSNNLIFIKTIN